MTTPRRRWIVAATLALAVAIALPVTDATAGKGDTIRLVANGRKLKFKRKLVCDGYTVAGVSIVGAQRPHRLGQIVRSVAIACANDLTMDTFPVSPQFCSIDYSEISIKRGVPTKQWVASNPAIQVTFDSFDGTRLQGTFSGTLDPYTGSTTQATITNGSFSLVLGGDACTQGALSE